MVWYWEALERSPVILSIKQGHRAKQLTNKEKYQRIKNRQEKRKTNMQKNREKVCNISQVKTLKLEFVSKNQDKCPVSFFLHLMSKFILFITI